jgi:hypothetical protein
MSAVLYPIWVHEPNKVIKGRHEKKRTQDIVFGLLCGVAYEVMTHIAPSDSVTSPAPSVPLRIA